MSTFRSTFIPFYYFSFIFVVTPIIWKSPPLKKSCESAIVYSLAMFHFCTGLQDTVSWGYSQLKIFDGRSFSFVIYFVIKLVYSIVTLIMIVFCTYKKPKISYIIHCLENVDKKLKDLNIEVDNEGQRRKNIKLFGFSNLIFVIHMLNMAHIYHYPRTTTNLLSLFLRMVMKYTFMQFLSFYAIFIQRAILLRFQAVNKGLEFYFINNSKVGSDSGSFCGNREDVLFSLATIHDLLASLYEKHSNSISFQVTVK